MTRRCSIPRENRRGIPLGPRCDVERDPDFREAQVRAAMGRVRPFDGARPKLARPPTPRPPGSPRRGRPMVPIYAADGRSWPSSAHAAADLGLSDKYIRNASTQGGIVAGVRLSRTPFPPKANP